MIEFTRKSSSRIFLINFEGLSVFKIADGKLKLFAKFNDEDIGHDNFRNYLFENPPTPVTLLIDSIAEDFLVEKVPHVSALDRKSFLQRKTDQHFRGIEYRSAKILGRESSGRRDDQVLFSAITKNQAVDNWVRVLLSAEIPIDAITTPAYALCKIAEEYELLTSDKVLLVNWEASGIRHTYVVNKRMMFSRLTPLPADQEGNLVEEIMQSCNQSNDYLEGVGLIDFEDAMDVHVITPMLDDDAFADFPAGRNFSRIQHHSPQEFLPSEQFGGPVESVTAILLCVDWGLRKGELTNIYAPPSARRFQQLRQAQRWVYIGALAVLLMGVFLSAPLIVDALSRQQNIARISENITPVQNLYDSLTAQFPETPIPSETMELAVGHFDVIQSQSSSPEELLNQVSDVVARHPGIVITNVDWTLEPVDIEVSLTQALINNETYISLSLFGTLIGSTSIQNSDVRLRAFIDDLGRIEGAGVNPISLPIERDPNSEVITVIDDQTFDANFALNIRMDT